MQTQTHIDWEFKKTDWKFERSSGYGGERNKYTDEWIFDAEYNRRKSLMEQFDAFKKCCVFFNYDPDEEKLRSYFEAFLNDGFYLCKSDK